MIYCAVCRTEMSCIKVGVGIDFGNGHVYASDLYQCRHCNATVARANDHPYHDSDYHREYYITDAVAATRAETVAPIEKTLRLDSGNEFSQGDEL